MKTQKSYSKLPHLLTKLSAASGILFMLASCGGGTGKPLSEAIVDPAGTCREYLSDIRKHDGLSADDLVEHLEQWQTVRDSVSAYFRRDTLGRPHSDSRRECELLYDTIRTELSRLALSKPRTYKEVLMLKERLSPYAEDKELHDAAGKIRPFFASLDSRPAHKGDGPQILSAYRTLLAQTIRDGIHGLDDLTAYIEKEDALFRAILPYLHDSDGADVADITRDTERCCSQVFLAAGRREITYRDAMIYLAMRTNRRLIQNVQTCIDDIRNKKVGTPEQAHAYIWMVLQPYASSDGFCLALLSPDERKRLDKIAGQTPAAFETLRHILQSEDDRLEELPGMLMEIFIQSL